MSTDIVDTLRGYYSNFTNNMSDTLTGFSIRDYIRLVWIIGGYIFLRPYLDKGFKKLMESGSAKEEEEEEVDEGHEDVAAKMSANALRGIREKVDKEQDEDDDSDVGESTGVSWGKNARRKQRRTIAYLEKELERKREEEDINDIADLLED